MKNRSFDLVFFFECLSSLKNLIPILELAIKNRGDLTIAILIWEGSNKYNSISSKENTSSFMSILNRIEKIEKISLIRSHSDLIKMNKLIECNFLFSSERTLNPDSICTYKKRYCVQFYYDWEGWPKGTGYGNKIKQNEAYIAVDKFYHDDIKSYYPNFEVLVPPSPTSFWSIDSNNSQELIKSVQDTIKKNSKKSKIAFLFYPEEGNKELVEKVISFLSDNDCAVIIKQRRKNQPIPPSFYNTDDVFITYDEIWYPSEGVVLPYISDLCIGFGTSAYVDIVAIGKKFIDICLYDYSLAYSKPISNSNYYQAKQDEKSLITSIQKTILKALRNNTDLIFKNSNKKNLEFLNAILKAENNEC
jgi:hypothetical protein